MRASLENFGIFILKLLFPSIFLLVLQILCVRHIFNFRCQITSAYIYNQRSFLLLFMVWCYYIINNSIPTNTNIEQMCMRASGASLENFEIFTFLNCYFFQYLSVHQILCRYKWHACQLKCTDKFPNVPTKLRKSIIGRGAVAPLPPPPPPSGYANVPIWKTTWFVVAESRIQLLL